MPVRTRSAVASSSSRPGVRGLALSRKPSPGVRGSTCRCTWKTSWPAATPSARKKFTPSEGTALFRNDHGRFVNVTAAAHAGRAVRGEGCVAADFNGDGRPDLYVAGYTEPNAAIPGSMAGFPTNHLGVRDLLFLNDTKLKGDVLDSMLIHPRYKIIRT